MPAPRTHSIGEVAEALGYSVAALSRHRIDDRIVFDDGAELRIIRLGRRMRIPAVELDRLLGEEACPEPG